MPRPKVPNWKSRRLASRAREVFAAMKETSIEVASFAGSLTVSADNVIACYDSLVPLARNRREATAAKQEAIRATLEKLRGWLGPVSRVVTGLKRGDFRASPDVIDDVMNLVSQFLAAVDEHEQKTGVPLPFGDVMRTELQERMDAAKAAWLEGLAIEVAMKAKQEELRAACEAFNADLIAFRTTVAAVAGTESPHYRMLRGAIRRGNDPDELEEADEDEDDESEAVTIDAQPAG